MPYRPDGPTQSVHIGHAFDSGTLAVAHTRGESTREWITVSASMTIHHKTMARVRMVLFGVSTSGLTIELVGGIPTAYGVSGDRGLPLALLLVGAVLGLLSVGYLAMARKVRHPAVYYAVAAVGLGRAFGVAAGRLRRVGHHPHHARPPLRTGPAHQLFRRVRLPGAAAMTAPIGPGR